MLGAAQTPPCDSFRGDPLHAYRRRPLHYLDERLRWRLRPSHSVHRENVHHHGHRHRWIGATFHHRHADRELGAENHEDTLCPYADTFIGDLSESRSPDYLSR